MARQRAELWLRAREFGGGLTPTTHRAELAPERGLSF